MSVNAIANVVQFEAAGMAEARHPLAGSAMLSEEAWAEIACALHLSGRELETVRGVFDNDKETAIAADLGIASSTVHTHMERLFRKLGVTTRVELVLRVMEAFLIQKCRRCASARAVQGCNDPLQVNAPELIDSITPPSARQKKGSAAVR